MTAEISAQVGQQSRARNSRDTASTPAGEFALLVDNDVESADRSSPAAQQATPNQQSPATQPAPTNAIETDIVVPALDAEAIKAASATNVTAPTQPISDTGIINDPDTDVADDAIDAQASPSIDWPLPVVAGPQANAGTTPPPPVIESSSAIAPTNPAATLPAETAALALARVAQDAATADAGASANVETTGAQIPAETAASTADPSKPATPPLVASASADANIALQTATELMTRVPVEATAVEAAAVAQTITAAPVEVSTQHGRLTTGTSAAANVIFARPNTATSIDASAAKSEGDQDAAKPADSDAKSADSNGIQADRQASGTKPKDTDNAVAAATVQDKATPAPAPTGASADNAALTALASATASSSSALHAPTNTHQLTGSTNPSMLVPVPGLAVEIAANAQIGRSRFEIRLDPPELGRIDVSLDVDRQGQVTSHIYVEKAATLDLLRRDAPQLERALQDAGLKTSDSGLQFSLRDQQSQTGRQNDGGTERNAQRLTIIDDETIPRETAGRTYGRMLSPSGGIDMRV